MKDEFLVTGFAQGLAYRRGLDELGTRADNCDDFHEMG